MGSLHRHRDMDSRAYSRVPSSSDDTVDVYVTASVMPDPPAPASAIRAPSKSYPASRESRCTYTTCALTFILVCGAIIAIVLGACGVFGTITYTHFVQGVSDPYSDAAMLTPAHLNAAVANIYAILENAQVLSSFMRNFTEQLHQPMTESAAYVPDGNSTQRQLLSAEVPSPFFSDGSYGAAMVQHLVGLTASLQNVSTHVEPQSVGKIITATGNMMAALNATDLAPSVQKLVSQAALITQKTAEGLNSADLELLLHNTATISVKQDLLPRLDKGMSTLSWVLQALHTPMPAETPMPPPSPSKV